MSDFATRFARARTQRAPVDMETLVERTGIEPARLAAIVAGTVGPDLGEMLLLSWGIECWFAELCERDEVAERVVFSHGGTGPASQSMKTALLDFMRLSDYLDAYGIAHPTTPPSPA